MPFKFTRLSIPEIILIEPQVFRDDRGSFVETYKYSDFAAHGITGSFVQDNHSTSVKGVLRGLHYQTNPKAQGKLIRCMKGRIFDIAVDIRRSSPTYRKWVGFDLSEDTNLMLYIPPGFAHGFMVLTDIAEVLYKCTTEYSPENERGIFWNDPDINIDWPIKTPVLSAKDKAYPMLKESDNNFE